MYRFFTASIATVLLTVFTGAGSMTRAEAHDYYIGEIFFMATNYCPRYSMTSLGQQLPISMNTALFALLGTTYGGNGTTSFALPSHQFSGVQPREYYVGYSSDRLVQACVATQGIFPPRP